MDDDLALAALLAEAAGTVLPSEAETMQMETLVNTANGGGADGASHESGDAGSSSFSGPSAAAPASVAARSVPVSSAFALTLNQYMGQHPALFLSKTKVFAIHQCYVDYNEVSEQAITSKARADTAEGDNAGSSPLLLEAKVQYQQWIGSCQEALELERLAAVYADPVAALNASLARLHELSALPAKANPNASTIYFEKKDLPADVTHGSWARNTLDNPLARAAYYVHYGPLFRTDSVAACMALEKKASIDAPPSAGSANNSKLSESTASGANTTTFTSMFSSSSLLSGANIARSDAWAAAADRIARDVYDRQAWLTLLASIKGLPLVHVRHVWQAFCFYFPTCGPIIQYYLLLEMKHLTGSSDGANRYGLGPEGLRLNERIYTLQSMNGVKDTDDQSTAEANFKAILRIANCFARHLPLCCSPSMFELFNRFVLDYIPTDDVTFGTAFVDGLSRVGRLPTSNALWHSFISVLQTFERRVGSAKLWQLYITWGAGKPGDERSIDGRGKTGYDLVSKVFLRVLTNPLEGKEVTKAEYERYQQRCLNTIARLEKATETRVNASRESFKEGWRMWGDLFHGCYEPHLPYLRLVALPYGVSGAHSRAAAAAAAAAAAEGGVGAGGGAAGADGGDAASTFSGLLASEGVAPAEGEEEAIGFGEDDSATTAGTSAVGGSHLSATGLISIGDPNIPPTSPSTQPHTNGAIVANGQHMSNRPRETPFLPIPMGHRDVGRFEAEEERISAALAAAGHPLGGYGYTAAGGGGIGVGADDAVGGGGPHGSGLRAKISAPFRSLPDAEGLRPDFVHWQLWERIINYERSADRLASSNEAHTARILQFLQWRVAHFPHHPTVHLELAAFIERSSTITDRVAKARDVLERAVFVLPESKVLIAEFSRLLRTSLAEEERGHVLFRNAVERAKTRLALFKQRVPLAAPLGADFLAAKLGPALGGDAQLRTATDQLSAADIVAHSKLLSLARAQAEASLELVQSLLTWYALWMQWSREAFKSRGADHMRLVAQHAFGETNIVLVVIQEVQRLYKALSLPFFVDPTRVATADTNGVAAIDAAPIATTTATVSTVLPTHNSALAALLSVLTTSGNSAVEADTCIRGRGAGGSIVFAPRHFFASLNALCKLWCHTEAVRLQAHGNALLIFTTWTAYLRSMLENTAPRGWSPADCGVDEAIFAAAHTLLEVSPQNKPQVFAAVSRLMAVVSGGGVSGGVTVPTSAEEDAAGAGSVRALRDMAIRLFMRFDPRNEWQWGSAVNAAKGTVTEPAAKRRPTPATIVPSAAHVVAMPFGPVGGSLISTMSAVGPESEAAAVSGDSQHASATTADALLLGLARRWQDSTLSFDAASADYAPAAVPPLTETPHCDGCLDDLLGPRHCRAAPATEAAAVCLERALAASLTIPTMTPFTHLLNPHLVAESSLGLGDDGAGGFGGLIGGGILDLDSNDPLYADDSAAGNNGNAAAAPLVSEEEAAELEAKRQRDILMGIAVPTAEASGGSGSGAAPNGPAAPDPLLLSPYNWWAPARCMDRTPHAFRGVADLFAAVPSTVPYAAQGLLDLVRSYAAAEHTAAALQARAAAAFDDDGATSDKAASSPAASMAALLGNILSNANLGRGAVTRADVVNPDGPLRAIDAVGLAQLSAAMDTFALPCRLSRFSLAEATAAQRAAVEAEAVLAKSPLAVTAADENGGDQDINSAAQQQQQQIKAAAEGTDAFTRALIANALVGYDDPPAPLSGSEWAPYKPPMNPSEAYRRQRSMRQFNGRGGRGGFRGRGGRGDGRGGRGRGGRGGWGSHNHQQSRRQSLLMMDDAEERKALLGEFVGLDSDQEEAAADMRRMPARLPEGVYAPQRNMSQFSARTVCAAPRPYFRSLEFAMDNMSLMLATRRETEEMRNQIERTAADRAERERRFEERNKLRSADRIFSGPRDSHAAALAAYQRREREHAASAAAASIVAQHGGVLPQGMALESLGSRAGHYAANYAAHAAAAAAAQQAAAAAAAAEGGGAAAAGSANPTAPQPTFTGFRGGYGGRGAQQSPLEVAERQKRRILGAIATRAYPHADVWVPMLPTSAPADDDSNGAPLSGLKRSRSATAGDEDGSAPTVANNGTSCTSLEAASALSQQLAERGNTYFAPLHFLMSRLPRHTFSEVAEEASEATMHTADSIIQLLKDTPSLRGGGYGANACTSIDGGSVGGTESTAPPS